MQSKQTRDFCNVTPETSERIRLVETALRAAAQRPAPQASSGGGCSGRQHSTRTPSAGAQGFRKSRIVALIGLALLLPSLLGVAVWLGVLRSPLPHVSQQSQFVPSPVLTAPAFLEATAGESISLPIALDGTDEVPAGSAIAITGLPQGSTLSKGQPLGDRGWRLQRDEIGNPQLALPRGAHGQVKLTIQLVAPDATVIADAVTVLQVATASQDSLSRNAEDANDAPLAPANQEPALFERTVLGVSPEIATVSGVSPEITDGQLAHETPRGQPDPGLPEAKPSAAATEREQEAAQPERRIVPSQRSAPAKRTVAIVGTNEVKTSVFVNLRQAPSSSAGIIRVIAKGTNLRVVARKGRWAQVTDSATSANGWIYMGKVNPSSAPVEPSEDAQPNSDSFWPSLLRGALASQ